MMEKVDIFSVGWGYDLILFMLFAVFAVDAVSIVSCLRKGKEDITEYAELCVKYLKILMCAFAGVFFLIVAFTYGYDFATTLIHIVMGVLMLIDAIVCLVLKIRFTRKKGKK